MASITASIELVDRVSATLNSIQERLYSVTSAFDAVDTASNRCLDAFQIGAVAQEMMNYERQIEDVETELIQANAQIERMQKETDEAADEANKLQTSFGNIAGVIGGLGIAYMVQDQIRQAIDYASDLTEVQNVVDVSFGQSAAIINEWAKTTLDAYGMNELTAKQYAGTMGAILNSSGVAGEAVTDMSMRMAELAGDMASFYNLPLDDAFYKIRAGITGETEPLKDLGINMNVAYLEAYALSQGIQESYNEMSQAEQVLLRYNYLIEAADGAQGDFIRTIDSYANQQRLLTQNVLEFTGTLAANVIPILARVTSVMNNAVKWISNNWTTVQPLVLGLTAAVGLYTSALVTNRAVTLANAVAHSIQSIHLTATSAASFAAMVATEGLNAALLACPITWIIAGIIGITAVIFYLAQVFADTRDDIASGFGVIMGVVAVAGAFLYNTFIGIFNAIVQFFWTGFAYPAIGIIEFVLNAFNGGFNSFGDAVANLIGNIIGWFLSLGTVVTKIIDAIFGTDWTNGLNALQDSVVEWGKNEEAITLDRNFEGLESIGYGGAFNAGAAWGDSIVVDTPDSLGLYRDDTGTRDNAGLNGNVLNEIAVNTANTANAVNGMTSSVDISNEQLQYMRDLAEQEVINRFTTAEMKVDMSGMSNTVNNGMDLDTMIGNLRGGIMEAMQVSAEALHN